jgi:hypothetical protein
LFALRPSFNDEVTKGCLWLLKYHQLLFDLKKYFVKATVEVNYYKSLLNIFEVTSGIVAKVELKPNHNQVNLAQIHNIHCTSFKNQVINFHIFKKELITK